MRLPTPSLDTNSQIGRFSGHNFDPRLVPEFDPARILPQDVHKCNPLVELGHGVKNCTPGELIKFCHETGAASLRDDSQQIDDDEWLPSAIYLIDSSKQLVDAWNQAFTAIPEVKPILGDYFQQPADAIVSPANSFGIMDGGLDLAIRDKLGYGVQGKIQAVIIEKYHGELPIGCAEIIETDHERWKYMVAAPTMRVPEFISSTINSYLAFRAILLAIENFNRSAGTRTIDSLVCSGLGTGVGGMSATKCAGQMQMAYKTMIMPAVIGRFESIHSFHRALRST